MRPPSRIHSRQPWRAHLDWKRRKVWRNGRRGSWNPEVQRGRKLDTMPANMDRGGVLFKVPRVRGRPVEEDGRKFEAHEAVRRPLPKDPNLGTLGGANVKVGHVSGSRDRNADSSGHEHESHALGRLRMTKCGPTLYTTYFRLVCWYVLQHGGKVNPPKFSTAGAETRAVGPGNF